MAISPHLRGISVSLFSEGQRQNEYPDTDGPQPNQGISTYLEVNGNAEFIIRCEVFVTFGPPGGDITFIAEVDGTEIAMYRAPYRELLNPYFVADIDGLYQRINNNQVVCRPLKFRGLEKVDDEDSVRVKNDIKLLDGVGEVKVSVHRTTLSGDERPIAQAEVKEVRGVSEKALKGQAISHSVAYGAERKIQRPKGQGTHFLDGKNNPLGVFHFKYRSRQDLQALLVIPRSPSPEPLPLQETKSANLKQETIAIKDEVDEVKSNRKRRISEMPQSGRAYKTSRKSDGKVVVDLTDD